MASIVEGVSLVDATMVGSAKYTVAIMASCWILLLIVTLALFRFGNTVVKVDLKAQIGNIFAIWLEKYFYNCDTDLQVQNFYSRFLQEEKIGRTDHFEPTEAF